MFAYRWLPGLLTLCFIGLLQTPALADFDDLDKQTSEINTTETSLGYRALSVHGAPGRAGEYQSLKASPTFGFDTQKYGDGLNLILSGDYLSEDDHRFESDLNYQSQLRLLFRSERFVHNLDHIPYDPAFDTEARQNGAYAGGTRTDFSDSDPLQVYGIQIDRNEVHVRAKLPDYPAHLNLNYWRWEKSGHRQLRYVNENCATSCHMRSTSRKIDRVTEEVKASIDGHVGFLDLAFEQIFRTFKDKAKTPFDSFDGHFMRIGPAFYQHDQDPDATFRESTLKANTTLGGGLVVSSTLSIGQRENQSNLFDVGPVESTTDFTKFASDVTYTPSQHWTWNFRYRMLDLNQDNSDVIGGAGYQEWLSAGTLRNFPVRDSIDIQRDYYVASVAYRPTPRLTLKGDYRREEIRRSDTGGPFQFDGHGAANGNQAIIDPVWELPKDELIQRYRLSVSSRHLEKNALRLKAWYELQTSDDPAYNTSVEEGHTFFASATYRPGFLWGTNASVKVKQQQNYDQQHSQFDNTNTAVFYDQDRDLQQQQLSLGLWLNPTKRLNLDLNYGYLRTRILQDLLFGAQPNQANPLQDFTIEDGDVEYRQSVQTLSLGATLQATDEVQCRLEGYHIRSEATYSPGFMPTSYNYGFGPLIAVASPDDLRQISKVDIRQNGIRGRVNWQIDDNWSATFEASFDDYDDHGADAYDGSVQTYLCSLSRTW